MKTLEGLLSVSPALVRERLDTPGAWLRKEVSNALDGDFAKPYLLWFVAGNPTRRERLSPNIAAIADVIIQAAKRVSADRSAIGHSSMPVSVRRDRPISSRR